MTRSKKRKLKDKWARADIAVLFKGGYDGEFADEAVLEELGRSVKLDTTRRRPVNVPKQRLAEEGARRLIGLGKPPGTIRAPRRHHECGRVHEPGRCELKLCADGRTWRWGGDAA